MVVKGGLTYPYPLTPSLQAPLLCFGHSCCFGGELGNEEIGSHVGSVFLTGLPEGWWLLAKRPKGSVLGSVP